MSDLRDAAEKALKALEANIYAAAALTSHKNLVTYNEAITALKAALEQPERTLTDEVIADLWHANGGFHHHFARAVERYLKGEK
jgi:gamma-glutamylcysteine synthetase